MKSSSLIEAFRRRLPLNFPLSNYSKYYGRTKVFRPEPVRVNESNSHLEISLGKGVGESWEFLGVMDLGKAQRLQKSEFPDLKLVLVSETDSPVQFSLLTGQQLFEFQKFQRKQPSTSSGKVVKTIQLSARIAELDLKIRLGQMVVASSRMYRIDIRDGGKVGCCVERVKEFVREKGFEFSVEKDEENHVILLVK